MVDLYPKNTTAIREGMNADIQGNSSRGEQTPLTSISSFFENYLKMVMKTPSQLDSMHYE
jgi:hypothetical protein